MDSGSRINVRVVGNGIWWALAGNIYKGDNYTVHLDKNTLMQTAFQARFPPNNIQAKCLNVSHILCWDTMKQLINMIKNNRVAEYINEYEPVIGEYTAPLSVKPLLRKEFLAILR
ncbi:Protein of unknown function [Gryllus bimaculatus]|nr:Protein of unknown function [Gryllus bimaculatus]